MGGVHQLVCEWENAEEVQGWNAEAGNGKSFVWLLPWKSYRFAINWQGFDGTFLDQFCLGLHDSRCFLHSLVYICPGHDSLIRDGVVMYSHLRLLWRNPVPKTLRKREYITMWNKQKQNESCLTLVVILLLLLSYDSNFPTSVCSCAF